MVISPDEVNRHLNTVIVIPLTSTIKNYPTRVSRIFDNKKGQLAIDQMRAVDKMRLKKKVGSFNDHEFIKEVLTVLQDMFSC